tara:strand:- start:395 stop:541 length:147 start_codon:yes stop_codon:yes gene_type:complete
VVVKRKKENLKRKEIKPKGENLNERNIKLSEESNLKIKYILYINGRNS